MTNTLPLSLYIHIPWCVKKYKNCDFNSCICTKSIDEKIYINHLLNDLTIDSSLIQNRTINSIFIGGTPNLFHNDSIKNLLNNIKKIVKISDNAEITIESSPTIPEIKNLLKYKKCEINRFSIQIQTFNSKILHFLGKSYTQKEILKSINCYNIKKLKNVNLDLTYGFPNQSLQEALLDLKIAISLKPNHISWNQFTIETNTCFFLNKSKLPNLNIIWKIFVQGTKLLKNAGYKKYELSSYSKKKKYACSHNLNYWKYGDYLGIGCGSHGKITNNTGEITRIIKQKKLNKFINGNYTYKKKIVLKKNLPLEFFMNYFQLYAPVLKKNFKKYTNLSSVYIKNEIKQAIKKKYLIQTEKYWKVTKKGMLFLNDLLEIFIK